MEQQIQQAAKRAWAKARMAPGGWRINMAALDVAYDLTDAEALQYLERLDPSKAEASESEKIWLLNSLRSDLLTEISDDPDEPDALWQRVRVLNAIICDCAAVARAEQRR